MIGTGAIASARFLDEKAVKFNGTNQLLTIPDHPYMADTQGAWSFWFKLDTLLSAPGFKMLVSADMVSGGNKVINIGLRRNAALGSGTFVDITIANPTIRAGSGTAVPITAGTTYHVVYGSDANLYINGVLVTLVSWFYPLPPAGTWYSSLVGGTGRNIAVAGNYRPPTSVNWADVAINDMVYYNAPLTAGEVTEVYAAGKRTNPNRWTATLRAKIKSFYPFETSLNDKIGAQNWTAIGSPTYVTP